MKQADMLARLIRRMQITEKGTALTAKANQYLFEVCPEANKLQIRKAVEEVFHVKVVKVNTMNYSGKRKRMRSMQYGRREDWKRAVVTLAEGSKIETA